MHVPMNLLSDSTILIAGAGGGFDFLCGLPLAYELEAQGHRVIFSSYSFTDLKSVDCESLKDRLYKITSLSLLRNGTYFPEGFFAKWYLTKNKKEIPVYCYNNVGVLTLTEYFNTISSLHKINAVIVIDGGVDGIFRGDEYGLGTPSIDSISMIAANECNIKEKYYVMTGFGSEGVGDEVSHAEVLQRISDLVKNNTYFGVTALLKNCGAANCFIDAAEYIFGRMPAHQHSNIVCSILKSISGEFGFNAVNTKTEINPIWISALTSMYWIFDLNGAAKMKLFYNKALKTDTVQEISKLIENYRGNAAKLRMTIPL